MSGRRLPTRSRLSAVSFCCFNPLDSPDCLPPSLSLFPLFVPPKIQNSLRSPLSSPNISSLLFDPSPLLHHRHHHQRQQQQQHRTGTMRRRRLRLNGSDDESDAPQPGSRASPESHQQSIPRTDACPPHSSPTINISDEETGEFIDVSEDLSTPSPPPPTSPPPDASSIPAPTRPAPAAPPSFSPAASFDCPVSDYLGRMGVMLRREWLHDCLDRLKESVRDFPALDVASKAKLCFEQFLLSDMNYSGGGVLPANVDALHLVDLAGPLVLQVCLYQPALVSITHMQSYYAGPVRICNLENVSFPIVYIRSHCRPFSDLPPCSFI